LNYYPPNEFGFAVDNPRARRAAKTNINPSQNHWLNNLRSPFQMMIEEGVLDNNIFSLKFPSNESDEGYLIFGGYDNTTFDVDLVSHPIYPSDTKRWSIEASFLSMTTIDVSGSPRALINKSLKGYQAIFSTRSFSILFPEPLFSQIVAPLNITKGICQEFTVDCNSLEKFPVITIGLGDQKISLTGRDYIQKIRGERSCKKPGFMECVPAIKLQYDRNPRGAERSFTLGLAFLDRVYSVFNHDEKTISSEFQIPLHST
jgi:hypothetical protein